MSIKRPYPIAELLEAILDHTDTKVPSEGRWHNRIRPAAHRAREAWGMAVARVLLRKETVAGDPLTAAFLHSIKHREKARTPCPETPPCYACRKLLAAGDPFGTAYAQRGMPPGWENVRIHAGNARPGTPEGVIVEARPRTALEAQPMELRIAPGNASAKDIAELFSALNALYQATGGSGLKFTIKEG